MTKDELHHEVKKLAARAQSRGATFFRYNAKTLVSLDVDTICPKAEAGNACKYCYRHDLQKAKRLSDKVYHNAIRDHKTWAALEYALDGLAGILEKYGMSPDMFSIRTFSLSDFRPEHAEFWRLIWQQIISYGFRVHVITKQLEHVHFMANHVDNVQVSVDNLDHPHRVKATALCWEYDNVFLRGVELNEDDTWLRNIVDVVTVYHGNRVPGLLTYRTTHKSHKALCSKVQGETESLVCCETGTCIDCQKCWFVA